MRVDAAYGVCAFVLHLCVRQLLVSTLAQCLLCIAFLKRRPRCLMHYVCAWCTLLPMVMVLCDGRPHLNSVPIVAVCGVLYGDAVQLMTGRAAACTKKQDDVIDL